jgi:hypothetical protein
MAERKVVSTADLNLWLTGEVRSVAGCAQCELTWKYRLREPEKRGEHLAEARCGDSAARPSLGAWRRTSPSNAQTMAHHEAASHDLVTAGAAGFGCMLDFHPLK